MSERAAEKRTRRPLEPPLVEEKGHVFVTFDAGGQGTSVNPNPVRPRMHEHEMKATIEWHLDAELRRNPQWEAPSPPRFIAARRRARSTRMWRMATAATATKCVRSCHAASPWASFR